MNSFAQIKVDRLFPPIVASDQSTSVVAEGKFPTWPPQTHCDRGDVSIVAEKKPGNWSVKVDSNAKPGVAWIRFFDESSASDLKPLLITAGPVQVEKEPNDSRSDAEPITLPHTVTGKLAKRGDSDAFRVSLTSGDQLVVTVIANQVLKSPMDAVLQLTDDQGNVLIQNDDYRGLDPQLVYRADQDRNVIVRLFAFPETPNSTIGYGGSAAFIYALQMTTAGYLDHAAILNDGIQAFGHNLSAISQTSVSKATYCSPPIVSTAGALGWTWLPNDWPLFTRHLCKTSIQGTIPMVVSGHLNSADEKHTIQFETTKGSKYHAEVVSKRDGFLLDSKLTVRDVKSSSILASNDDISRGGYDAGVDFTAKENATVSIELSDIVGGHGPRHFYQLVIREQKPDCQLSIAADHFVIAADATLEIPISVSRQAGFAGRIKLSVIGAPDDVLVESAISEAKGDSAKTVKLKLTSNRSAAWNGLIKVVGIEIDESDNKTGKEHQATYSLRPAVAVKETWLTVQPSTKSKEEKEDQ